LANIAIFFVVVCLPFAGLGFLGLFFSFSFAFFFFRKETKQKSYDSPENKKQGTPKQNPKNMPDPQVSEENEVASSLLRLHVGKGRNRNAIQRQPEPQFSSRESLNCCLLPSFQTETWVEAPQRWLLELRHFYQSRLQALFAKEADQHFEPPVSASSLTLFHPFSTEYAQSSLALFYEKEAQFQELATKAAAGPKCIQAFLGFALEQIRVLKDYTEKTFALKIELVKALSNLLQLRLDAFSGEAAVIQSLSHIVAKTISGVLEKIKQTDPLFQEYESCLASILAFVKTHLSAFPDFVKMQLQTQMALLDPNQPNHNPRATETQIRDLLDQVGYHLGVLSRSGNLPDSGLLQTLSHWKASWSSVVDRMHRKLETEFKINGITDLMNLEHEIVNLKQAAIQELFDQYSKELDHVGVTLVSFCLESIQQMTRAAMVPFRDLDMKKQESRGKLDLLMQQTFQKPAETEQLLNQFKEASHAVSVFQELSEMQVENSIKTMVLCFQESLALAPLKETFGTLY